MARIVASKCGETPFQQMMGHNPEIMKQWESLLDAFLNSSTFTKEFKEELRRVLAYANGCRYCMSKGAPSEQISDMKTLQAVSFAKTFAFSHRAISKEYIESLKEFFSDAEVSELCALISFFCATHRFGAILALEPACEASVT